MFVVSMWISPGGLQTFLFLTSTVSEPRVSVRPLLMQGETWLAVRWGRREKKKEQHKRKGMKVVLNMHFNGGANSSQIGREHTGVRCCAGRQPDWRSDMKR